MLSTTARATIRVVHALPCINDFMHLQTAFTAYTALCSRFWTSYILFLYSISRASTRYPSRLPILYSEYCTLGATPTVNPQKTTPSSPE